VKSEINVVMQGTGYICESFIAYFGMCLSGLHTGKVILRLVEAVGKCFEHLQSALFQIGELRKTRLGLASLICSFLVVENALRFVMGPDVRIAGHPDVYLVGTVMLIFGMGLYGLFISNEPIEGQPDRALKNTTLFGMFALKVRKS